ncbi:M20/M25/M40 family metallo-hydrolase [Gudongella sp. SC589]|uniref:M20/M25/M40 family metallo-hydrolase n=1 Tax=Gudongella sp. SC589 TaxID=3385990 RepID=UPI0039048D5B
MSKDFLDSYIESSKDEMMGHILKIVSIPSFTGNIVENKKCLQYVLDLAEKFGFKTMTTSDMSVGIVEMGEGQECLGILVHVDIVGIGDPEKWTNGPFEGVCRDGFIWGRGTSDDKGAVIMSLYAMKAVLDSGVKFNRKVWLIIGTSEEGEWTDMETFKKEFTVPDFGFSPDGEFPVFNVEKGYADVILSFEEPMLSSILELKGGDSPNTVPSKAYIRLNDGREITVHGISTHSSTPEEGNNPIIELCGKLRDREESFRFARFVSRHLTNDGKPNDLNIDDGLDNYQGEHVGITTAAPTVLKLENGKLVLNVNIRQKYGTTLEKISRGFQEKSDEFGYSYEISNYLEPMRVSGDLPFLNIMREVSREYGVDDSLKVAAGTSYAKSMERFVSWGPVFPEDPQTAHMEDERISVETMLLAAKLYAYFVYRMANEEY